MWLGKAQEENNMKELIAVVDESIKQAIEFFKKSPSKFGNEQQFQEMFYNILAVELDKADLLFVKYKNGKKQILLIREKITKEKYRKKEEGRRTHGRLDFAILDPETIKNISFPETGADLKQIPLAVGIEIKLNVTDKKTLEKELYYLLDKLGGGNEKGEIKSRDGRYIVFLSSRRYEHGMNKESYEFYEKFKERVSKSQKVKIRSNIPELNTKW